MLLHKSVGIGMALAYTASSIAFAAQLSDVTNVGDKEAVDYLNEKGVVTGYQDGTFRPDNTINRAELLKILVGSVGITPDVREYHDCFPDVASEWFAPFVCYAKEKEWIHGYADETFKPANPVNTVESIKMIVNVYGYQPMQTSSVAPYGDVDLSAWYAPYVLLARNAGILDAINGNLGVSANITRGRVSGMIYRSMKSRSDSGLHGAANEKQGIVQTIIRSMRRGGGGSGGDESSSSSEAVLSSPTITFGDITKNYGDAAFALSPTSNSAGTFTYASSDTDVATIAGATVTIVGGGTVTITATQAAAGAYTSGSATATLTINAIAPTIGTFSNVTKLMGETPFALTEPSSDSDGAFTYASSNTGVVTVSGNTVTLVSSGSSTITATQAATANYTSGTKTMTMTIMRGMCGLTEPCLNGGTCTNAPAASYTCSCAEHYSGSDCEMDDFNCYVGSGFECLNGGTCTPTSTHGECACAECFSGTQCDQYICA